jgi:hypothetical protein
MQNNTVWLPVNYMGESEVQGISLIERKNMLQETVYNSGSTIYGVDNPVEVAGNYIPDSNFAFDYAVFEVLDFRNDMQEVQIKLLSDQLLQTDLSSLKVAFAYDTMKEGAEHSYIVDVCFAYLIGADCKPMVGVLINATK